MKRLTLSLGIVCCLLLMPLPAVAQTTGVQETILPNGLRVLLKEAHQAPVVTFQVWYKVGSRNERLGATGISHLLEHLMFKGTRRYGPKTFSQTVQRNGGNDNAFTAKDFTVYFETFAADRITIALALESDRMQNLLLAPQAFQSERKVVMEERRMRTDDDPTAATVEELTATAFLAHPYQWPVIGWMTDINAITQGELRDYYRTYYAPNNATIVVVGDFAPKTLLPQIRKYFGKIPRGPVVPPVTAVEPPQTGERRIIVKRQAELPVVFASYHTPDIKDADAYPLEVLQAVLAGGKSARLYRSLVYDQQIALFADADYDDITNDPGLFTLSAGVMPGKTTAAVEQALYAELDKLKQEPPTARELQKAKNQIEASFLMSQDSDFSQAMLLGEFASVGDWRLLGTFVDRIRSVTAADVQRVARKYFSEDNRTVAILVPTKDGTPRHAPAPSAGSSDYP